MSNSAMDQHKKTKNQGRIVITLNCEVPDSVMNQAEKWKNDGVDVLRDLTAAFGNPTFNNDRSLKTYFEFLEYAGVKIEDGFKVEVTK